MKSALFALMAMLFTFTIPGNLLAQEESQRMFVVISYMKSKSADYVSVEKDMWTPVHNEMIKQGKKVWWGFYQMMSPSGTSEDHNFITIEVYNSPSQYQTAYNGLIELATKAHGGKLPEGFAEKTGSSRDMVRSEMFEIIAVSTDQSRETPSPYFIKNEMYVAPGNGNAYVKMETGTFQPMHKAAIDLGYRNSWRLMGRWLPYGTEFGYNFMTFDSYPSFEAIFADHQEEIFKKAYGDKTEEEVFGDVNMNEMRELKRAELYRNIAFANGK